MLGMEPLARVCQQIRSEYLPLCRTTFKDATLYLTWMQLSRFLPTFYNKPDDFNLSPKLFGLLLDDATIDNRMIRQEYTDIYPLLEMKKLRPDFECSVEWINYNRHDRRFRNSRYITACQELNQLLNEGISAATGCSNLDGTFDQVRVYRANSEVSTRFFMKIVLLQTDARYEGMFWK